MGTSPLSTPLRTRINESIDGTWTEAELVSPVSGRVTVSLQPVNDIPVAQDREMRFTETGADVADEFTFSATI